MTAHELMDSIYRRGQMGVSANMRRITADQFRYLRDLIGAEDDGLAVDHKADGSLVWTVGREKYAIVPPLPGKKLGMVERLSNHAVSEMRSLF